MLSTRVHRGRRSRAAGLAMAVIAAATFALAAPGHAAITATYYVDCGGGSDANAGTSETSAWRSLAPVKSRTFAPGNRIMLKRGCSWDGGLSARSNGTADSPIIYTAYGSGAAPVIRNTTGGQYASAVDVTGDYNVIDGLLVRDAAESGVVMRTGADHNIVRNVEATAVGLGISAGGSDNLLTRNHVHDLKMVVNTVGGDDDYGAVCFWIQGPRNEISYNRGVNCRAQSYDYGEDGGFVEVWKLGDDTSVHHNRAESTNGFFEIGGSGSARSIRVANNVLSDVDGGMCLHNGGTFQITFDDFRFEHNTVRSTAGGYRFLDCVSGLTPSMVIMRNNVFHTNVRAISSSGAFTHSNNLYYMTDGATVGYALGSGEKTGDPKFADAAADDLRLQSGSPAVDAGAALGYPTDYLDQPRPVGPAPDLGAHELSAAAPAPSPTPSPTPTPTPTPSPTPTPIVTSLNDSSVGTGIGQFSYSGRWSRSTGTGKFKTDDRYTNAKGSYYTVRFSGTRARLYVATAAWHGKAGVSIDGGPETTIDLYSAKKTDQVLLFTSPVLEARTHTLTVRALGSRNASSTGTYVTADRVDVEG